jgi:Fumarylacetoacetate (FAA) hydrolase family
MKLVTFSTGGTDRIGVADPDAGVLRDVTDLVGHADLAAVIAHWGSWQRALADSKATTAVTGPHDDVDPHPGLTRELDYEGELAVIIGPGGRGISREDALGHVWGYTIVNDVTARDLQRDHKQWLLGKSLDTHCPMGPYAVSADEAGDVSARWLETRVNGELRQSAPVKDLIFDIPVLVETLSAGMTLLPGDIIATGTPAGVGIGFEPPRFLASGDVVEVSVTGLGTLRNRIARPAATEPEQGAGRRQGGDRPGDGRDGLLGVPDRLVHGGQWVRLPG